jgi:anti-sigma factor RsiW
MRLPRGHQPELNASLYLAGELGRRTRRWFERHLLECEDCWREVTLGRLGRRLAEELREVAPSRLRDDVRAAVAAAPVPRRRRFRTQGGTS